MRAAIAALATSITPTGADAQPWHGQAHSVSASSPTTSRRCSHRGHFRATRECLIAVVSSRACGLVARTVCKHVLIGVSSKNVSGVGLNWGWCSRWWVLVVSTPFGVPWTRLPCSALAFRQYPMQSLSTGTMWRRVGFARMSCGDEPSMTGGTSNWRCLGCGVTLFSFVLPLTCLPLLGRWAADPSLVPAHARSRPTCWYGRDCRTQVHNAGHASRFNHICERTAPP